MKYTAHIAIALTIIFGLYARTQNNDTSVRVTLRRMDRQGQLEVLATIEKPMDATGSADSKLSGVVADVQAMEPEEPVEKDVDVETLVNYIHAAESSFGKNANPNALHNLCKAQGKSNEYGYGGMAQKICFDSPEAARERVVRWVGEKLEMFDGDAAKTLCYYRHGKDADSGQYLVNCQYYQRFLGSI